MMNLSAEQIQLATLIDAHVSRYPDTELGDEQLLITLTDYMDAFKRIMDSSTPAQMDHLCQQYAGFYRFGLLLESLAQGIAEGVIEVLWPKNSSLSIYQHIRIYGQSHNAFVLGLNRGLQLVDQF